jgi:hypothetical protein
MIISDSYRKKSMTDSKNPTAPVTAAKKEEPKTEEKKKPTRFVLVTLPTYKHKKS